jgi:hypothetical protein
MKYLCALCLLMLFSACMLSVVSNSGCDNGQDDVDMDEKPETQLEAVLQPKV